MADHSDLGFTPSPHSDLGFQPANPPAFKEPEGSALSRLGSNIWDTTVGGIGRMLTSSPYDMFRDAAVAHIVQAAQAWDAYKRGDIAALGHAAAAAVPFIGPGLETAAEVMGGEAPVFDKYGNVIKQGRAPDIASGAGQMIGLGGSALLGEPVARLTGKAIDAVPVEAVVKATKGGIRSGLQAATETVPLTKLGVEVNVPKPLVTGAATAAAFKAVGLPGSVGGAIGAVAPIVRGIVRGARPVEPPVVSLGEEFAKSQGLDWAALPPETQAMLENSAQANAAAALPRPSYKLPPPDVPIGITPGKTLAEDVAEYIAANKPAPPEEPPPAPPVAPAAAAPSVPETPLPEVPVSAPEPAVAARPAAAQAAADLEAAMRPDRLADYLVANKIPGQMIDQFGPTEWQMVADQARTLPPTPEDIAAVRAKIGEYESAATMPAEAAKASPAEAVAEFEQRKATRRRKPVATQPAEAAPAAATAAPPAAVPPVFPPGVNPAQQLAEMMPEFAAEPPAAGLRAPTASEVRVETLAKALAAGDIPTSELARLPHITDAELLLEDLARAHGEARPTAAELPQIVDRVRQLRGEKPLEKGAGEAAYQEQQARIEPPTAGAAAEAPSLSETLDNAANAALERMRQRGTFSGTKLNAGIPVEDMKDMAIWGAAKLAKGTVDFAKWSREILAEAGPAAAQIKPYLQNLYEQSQKAYAGFLASTDNRLPATRRLMQMYRDGIDAKEWYDHAKTELANVFGPQDVEHFINFLAATSPNTTVAANTALALKAFAQFKLGRPFEGFLPDVIPDLEAASRGEGFGGTKIQNFARNLHGDPISVTIDRWMARALGFKTDSPTPRQYKFMDYLISQVANKAGVEPRQMQAAIWKTIKDLEGVESQGAEPYHVLTEKKFARTPVWERLVRETQGKTPAELSADPAFAQLRDEVSAELQRLADQAAKSKARAAAKKAAKLGQ